VLVILRFVTNILPIVAAVATAAGLLLAAAVKNSSLTDYVLPWYPRYRLSQHALAELQDMKYSIQTGTEQQPVSVLDIDDPAWPLLLKFVQSEIAIRKSERTEPGPVLFTPEVAPGSPDKPQPVQLPDIDFNRVKAFFVMKFGVVAAGPKPISPPYRLMVLWPGTIPRRIYEFLSFKEFEFDLRQMLVRELEFGGVVASFCSFVTGLVLLLVRSVLRRLESRVMATQPASVAGISNGP